MIYESENYIEYTIQELDWYYPEEGVNWGRDKRDKPVWEFLINYENFRQPRRSFSSLNEAKRFIKENSERYKNTKLRIIKSKRVTIHQEVYPGNKELTDLSEFIEE